MAVSWQDGDWVGPGPSYFQVIIGYELTDFADDSVHIRWYRGLKVSGNFYGTVINTSWAGDVSVYGNEYYAEDGWHDMGAVPYGTYDTTYARASYTGGSGSYYKSERTASITASAPTWVPYSVTGASASRKSDNRNVVSWTNNAHAARPYTRIYVDRQVDGGSWTNVATLSGSATSYTDNNTSANHSYRYRIVPDNAAGQPSHTYTGTVYNSPAAPSFLSVARKSATTVTAKLTNGANTATTLQYQSRKQGSSGWGEWSESASISGKVTSFDVDLGGGTFQLRARNVRGSLTSPWAVSGTVVTICAPNAPTLVSPASSSVIATDEQSVAFSWSHNPQDGSAQTSAELRISTDGGTTWGVHKVSGSADSVSIDNDFGLNSTVTWQVRTKGSHADFGPWSGSRVNYVRQRPTVTIEKPADGAVIDGLPVKVALGYIDVSGSLASAQLSVVGPGGVAYSKDMGTSTECEIDAGDYLLEDGVSYTIEVSARSSSTLVASASKSVSVEYKLPQAANASIEFDGSTGAATVSLHLSKDPDLADAVGISLYRIAGGVRLLLAEDVQIGNVVEDPYAPINIEFAYEAVTRSAAGSVNVSRKSVTLKSPWWFILFDGGAAKGMWNPGYSFTKARPSKTRQFFAGRRYPVSFDDGANTSMEGSVSLTLQSRDERAMFERLVESGGRCVFKSGDGDVFNADAEVSFEADFTTSMWGTVDVSLVRIDGDDL